MPKSHHSLLLGALLLAGGLAAGLLHWTGGGETPSRVLHIDAAPRPLEPGGRSTPVDPGRTSEIQVRPTAPEAPATTVAHPLRIELELLRAKNLLAAEGAPPQRSGARARLRGGVYGSDQRGVRAEVVFVAGANAGRVLATDESGGFGANDLYPGLSVVELRAPGLPGSQREIRLRNERETQLNVGYGRPSTVYGEVIDRDGGPIPFATVTMDGQRAQTNEEGVFHFPRMTSGEVLAIVSKPGYASYRELVNISAAHTIAIGRLRFLLEPSASLEVSVRQRVGAPGDSLLFIEPDHDLQSPGALFQRKFPWHLVNPVTIPPAGTVIVEDLPAMRVRLRLAHPGARAVPATQSIELVAGSRAQALLELEPAPMLRGRVLRGGSPVRGALVRLEVPNVAEGTAALLGQPLGILESEVRPNLPPALQTCFTDGAGEFELSSAEHLSAVRYLSAEGPGGDGWAGRVLRAGENQVELELGRAPTGRAKLRIDTLPRTQPLPIDLIVDGAPRDLRLLAPHQSLEIGELPPGAWRVRASFGSERLLDGVEIDIEGEADLFVPLPDEARNGPVPALLGQAR